MYARALTTNDRKRRHAGEKARTVIDTPTYKRERRRRQARVKTDSHRRTHTRTHLSELARVSRGRVMI